MDRTTSTTIVIAVILLAFAGMVIGWRGRQKRQAELPRPDAVPADAGNEILSVGAFYVATTVADQELNRIAVAGLGFRSRASVTVTDRGIVLALDATPAIFIPAAAIRGVDRATYAIDRVVEKGGLVRIAWTLGHARGETASDVDSYLRVEGTVESASLIESVQSLMPLSTETTDQRHQEGERP